MIKCFGSLARPFNQYHLGQRFVTRKRTIFESDLTSFVHLIGYTNENLFGDMTFKHALSTPDNKRLVPALLTMSIADGLITGSGILDGYAIGLVGIDGMKATCPVYAGDTLHVEFEVTNMIESKSKPDRGIVTTTQEVKNQDNITVLVYNVSRMLRKDEISKL